MEYTDQKCPVCGQPFASDSDVVVCPDCGTPHHRACYAETGYCASSDRHKEGYSYYGAAKPREKKPERPLHEAPAGEDKPSAPQAFDAYSPAAAYGFFKGEEVREDKDIGGITAGQYKTFLGKAAGAYIPRFVYLEETGKKIVFNIIAFFFPYTFAASKKMYKAAMLLLAVDLFFFGFSVYSSLNKAPMRALTDQIVQVSADGVVTDEERNLLTDAMQTLNETEIKRDWTDAVMELKYLDNIVMGLLATYFYKKDCARKIKVLRDAPVPEEVTQTAMRRVGKTAVLLPLMGYIAIAVTVYSVFGYLMLYK